MAIKGLSVPIVADYSETGGVVTYANGVRNQKAVSWQLAMELQESVKLYADNGVAEESKKKFKQAKLTIGTDDIGRAFAKKLLGLKEVTEGTSPDTVTVGVYDDDLEPGYLGFGLIEEHQVSGSDKYRAIILCKVKFDIPDEAANTRGETVSWQTKTVTGIVSRSDEVGTGTGAVSHPWMKDAWFDTEAAALTWLGTKLAVTG